MKQDEAITTIFDESNKVMDRAWNLQLAPPGNKYYSESAHREFSESLKRLVRADKALSKILAKKSKVKADV